MSYIDDLHVEQVRSVGTRIHGGMTFSEAQKLGVRAIAAKVLWDLCDFLAMNQRGPIDLETDSLITSIHFWAEENGIELSESPPISENRLRVEKQGQGST